MEEKEEKVIITMTKKPLASERAEIRKNRLHKISVVVLCIIFLIVGISSGILIDSYILKNNTKNNNDQLDDISFIMNKYWLYGNDYENLDDKLHSQAYYGMTSFLEDPYTTYMSVDDYSNFSTTINMDYVGIGLTYINYDNISTVTKVYKNSPAQKAGVLAGDIIKTIEGEPVDDLTSDQIKSRIIGEAGTDVKVGFLRNGEYVEFNITRGEVDSSVFCYSEDDYVVMELNSFGVDTATNIIKYLDEYRQYDKLIIDLRNNSGGYQSAVSQIAGFFIGENQPYMIQVDKDGNEKIDYTNNKVTYNNFKKIVILTNSNTASAAEVLTICLKEKYPNVTSIGETTYGKGVVQTTFNLTNGSAVKVTTTKWLSPNRVWINSVGITPDIEIKLPDINYEHFYAMNEDEKFTIDSVSEYVRLSSKCLEFLDYDIDRCDGYFDESIEDALNMFKANHNMETDGVLDYQTYEKLISAATHLAATDKQCDTQMLKAIEVIHED